MVTTDAASARVTRDAVHDVWGARTPYQGSWPVRVDERTLEPPERWIQSACVLCSNGCGMDIAVKDGRVAALGADVKGTATREIDAAGKFVLPGGVDSHCHIEQKSGFGIMCADDFYTGTVSAAFGGTTTVIPFAAQHRGMSLRQVVKD